MEEKTVLVKFGRELLWINHDDIIYDNGRVQGFQNRLEKGWRKTNLPITKKIFKDFMKQNILVLIKHNEETKIKYYKFDLELLEKSDLNYVTNTKTEKFYILSWNKWQNKPVYLGYGLYSQGKSEYFYERELSRLDNENHDKFNLPSKLSFTKEILYLNENIYFSDDKDKLLTDGIDAMVRKQLSNIESYQKQIEDTKKRVVELQNIQKDSSLLVNFDEY